MITKTTLKKWALCKTTALVLLFFAAICIFSSKTIAQNLPEQISENASLNQDDTEYIIPEQGVSQDLITEYRTIGNKYLDSISENKWRWKSKSLTEEDLKRLYIIHIQMDENQRREQNILFQGPLTPFALRKPDKEEWNGCQNADSIWLDGEKTDKSALKTHGRSDFVFFILHRKMNGKKIVAALWTQEGYDAYIQKYEEQIPITKLLEIEPILWFRTGRLKRDGVNGMAISRFPKKIEHWNIQKK
jgi:hypothetical protein